MRAEVCLTASAVAIIGKINQAAAAEAAPAAEVAPVKTVQCGGKKVPRAVYNDLYKAISGLPPKFLTELIRVVILPALVDKERTMPKKARTILINAGLGVARGQVFIPADYVAAIVKEHGTLNKGKSEWSKKK